MAHSSGDSVTDWIARIKLGDPAAAQQLWQRYVEQLIALARNRFSQLPGRIADEHDAVQSAFVSFFRRAEAGQFPLLNDRHDLWQLLVVISARKAKNLVRRELTQKRGAGRIRTAPRLAEGETDLGGLPQIVAPTPTPEFAAVVAEEFDRLLQLLDDAELRQLALLKFEGYDHAEIAQRLDCSERTVNRRIQLIRTIWGGGRTDSHR